MNKSEMIALVREPNVLTVTGIEDLTISEGVGLFFKELATSLDRTMSRLSGKAHVVDYGSLEVRRKRQQLNFVKDSGLMLVVPEGYDNTFGGMMRYTENVVKAVYLSSSLQTETRRLYSWLKEITRKGRLDSTFKYSITDFDKAVNNAEMFIKDLKDNKRVVSLHLKDLYVDYEEMFSVIHKFNTNVSNFKHRDIEMANRELDNVYDLGSLLIAKIENNEVTLSKESIRDLEEVVNKFTRVVNITGVMTILLNELSAVLTGQVKTVLENSKKQYK